MNAKFLTTSKAVEILKNNGIVAVPTETVYGLAGNATSSEAIRKIYKIKNRPADNPLICHFHSLLQLLEYVEPLNETEKTLAEHFMPGPFSLMCKLKSNSQLLNATAGSNFIIARIPNQPLFIEILKNVPFPLAAPSANTSGKFSGTNAQMISEDLGILIDGIVDGGNCNYGLESTIVDATNNIEIRILRKGPIGKLEIQKVIKGIPVVFSTAKAATPGSKYKHYAPKTKLNWFEKEEINHLKLDAAFLLTKQDFDILVSHNVKLKEQQLILLGDENNPEFISKNLYHNFYLLDKLNFNTAYISKCVAVSESGIAMALQDRIFKAAQ